MTNLPLFVKPGQLRRMLLHWFHLCLLLMRLQLPGQVMPG
jgi:hypothetical protein